MGSLTQTWRRIAPFADRGLPRLAGLVACSLASGATEAGILLLVTRVAVGVTEGAERIAILGLEASPGRWLLVALGLVAAKLLAGTGTATITAQLAAGSLSAARRALLRAFLDASWDRQSQERTGHLQELMTTNVDRVASIFLTLANGVTASVNLVILLVVALVVDPVAAVSVVAAGGLLLVALVPLTRRTKRNAQGYVSHARHYATVVAETVALVRDLRVFGVRRAAAQRVDADERRASGAYRRSRFLSTLAPQLYQGLALGFVVGAVGLVVLLCDADVAKLGAVVVLLLRCLSYGQVASVSNQQLGELVPHLDRLAEVRDEYVASAEPHGTARPAHVGTIRLRDVCFDYGDQAALEELDLVIRPGEALGIVGPSGSGKSTLLQLLLGLRLPTTGEIDVDGVPLRDVDPDRWSELVAVVPQDGGCFSGTVRENIAFYRDASEEAIERAARAANLHDEVLAWPSGYDTQVGDRGSALSGGQRQRICIARALLGEPELLILDEPTSALDVPSEARILDALQALRGRVTLVVVAHRLSTVNLCDRILVLVDGRAAALGAPDELRRSGGFYEEALRLSGIGS